MIMTGDEFTNLYVKNGKILPNPVTEISGNLWLADNNISVIENIPNTINGSLNLSYNNISIIQNLPNTISGYLYLSFNNITVIENLPTNLIGDLFLHDNPIYTQFENQSKYETTKEWAYAYYLMKKKLDAWSNL